MKRIRGFEQLWDVLLMLALLLLCVLPSADLWIPVVERALLIVELASLFRGGLRGRQTPAS